MRSDRYGFDGWDRRFRGETASDALRDLAKTMDELAPSPAPPRLQDWEKEAGLCQLAIRAIMDVDPEDRQGQVDYAVDAVRNLVAIIRKSEHSGEAPTKK